MRVLVVEDEVRLAETIRDGLTREGFTVDLAHDGVDGLWMATEKPYGAYDVVMLDIMLPKLNGYEICRTLRQRKVWTPVLMLTAKDGEYDLADALDLGADDYIVKPFSFVVLIARLRALVRRGAPERPAVLEAGDLTLDPVRAAGGSRRRDRRGHPAGVRAARVPHAQPRARRHQDGDHRERVGRALRR